MIWIYVGVGVSWWLVIATCVAAEFIKRGEDRDVAGGKSLLWPVVIPALPFFFFVYCAEKLAAKWSDGG